MSNESCRTIIATYAFAALAGPLLAYIATAFNLHGRRSADLAWLSRTVYDLTLMLWPTQVLATMEISLGSNIASLVAVGCNVLVFAFLGVVACVVARRRGLVILFCVLAIAVVWFGLGIAGYDFRFVSWSAIVAALYFFAALLAIVPVSRMHPK